MIVPLLSSNRRVRIICLSSSSLAATYESQCHRIQRQAVSPLHRPLGSRRRHRRLRRTFPSASPNAPLLTETHRRRPSSHRWTESRYSSKPPTQIISNMQVRLALQLSCTRYSPVVQGHGAVRFELRPRYTGREVHAHCSRGTQRPYCVFSRTRPLSSWPTINSRVCVNSISSYPISTETCSQIIMPTKDKQTNPRRFVSGALAGAHSAVFSYAQA